MSSNNISANLGEENRESYSFDGLEDTVYKGTVLSYSQRLHGLKFLNPSARQMSPSNGAENSTLEDSFSELLFDAIAEKFKSKVKSGIHPMGIPSMDPLRLERIHLEPTIGGDPFDITLKNVRIHGLSSFIVRDLTPKLSELRFRISIIFPTLVAECHYAVNGSIYDVLDVHGTGFGTMEYDDVLLRTSVNMESINGSLKIISADPPYVDYAKTMITLKSNDGRVTSGLSSIANELGPVLFWMLADQVVEEVDSYIATFLNEAIKSFKLPANFKPVVTWLIKRNSIHVNPLLKRLFPISSFGNLFQSLAGLKHQFNIPMVFESLRSNFRSNLRRFL
ncbi:hypothetical protein B4U79_08052 [Dinothrombium tinctorium]|uniref:Uncharacterized protein n=1 Tax=Dinothrombium tinctorium TaxID=1965070 RepID=A0A443RRI0_9ACAR|nr:hypothetical protein B4U79_08052 [Dinothrombium tinctorium]